MDFCLTDLMFDSYEGGNVTGQARQGCVPRASLSGIFQNLLKG